jgi:hypothetical protein
MNVGNQMRMNMMLDPLVNFDSTSNFIEPMNEFEIVSQSHTLGFSFTHFQIPENDYTNLNLKSENVTETSPNGCDHHKEGSIEINQTQYLTNEQIDLSSSEVNSELVPIYSTKSLLLNQSSNLINDDENHDDENILKASNLLYSGNHYFCIQIYFLI